LALQSRDVVSVHWTNIEIDTQPASTLSLPGGSVQSRASDRGSCDQTVDHRNWPRQIQFAAEVIADWPAV